MGGLVAAELALAEPERCCRWRWWRRSGSGAEIDAELHRGVRRGARTRRELKPVLQRLFADPSLVNRQMVDDVLKYKRLDGVRGRAADAAGGLFAGGRQQRVIAAELGAARRCRSW